MMDIWAQSAAHAWSKSAAVRCTSQTSAHEEELQIASVWRRSVERKLQEHDKTDVKVCSEYSIHFKGSVAANKRSTFKAGHDATTGRKRPAT